jgi:hypothetical protein
MGGSEKQVLRYAQDDNQKNKGNSKCESNSNSNSKDKYGGPSLRSG